MIPKTHFAWRSTLFVVNALWFLLCLPWRLLTFAGRQLVTGWKLLINGMDFVWDLGASLIAAAWSFLAPVHQPVGRAINAFLWQPFVRLLGLIVTIVAFVTAPVRRLVGWAWKSTEAARAFLADTPPLRPVVALGATLKRVGSVIKPYWFPHGWLSVLGMVVVGALTVGAYFGLQEVAGQMDVVTKTVMDLLKDGYWSFGLRYALPSVVVVMLAIYVGKKIWPKNANLDGLLLLSALLLLMLSVNTLNVILNFANGAITDALNHKDQAQFFVMVIRLLTCFIIGTVVVVCYSFVRNRLTLSWRKWYTTYIMEKYFENRNYYRVNYDPTIDNPDERIQQDIDGFVSGALSLMLTILGSIITYYTFVGILGAVDPTGILTWIAYGWSLIFTIFAVGVGKRLIGLNFDKSKKEADFRYNLIHVRRNVESIAFYHSEDRESGALKLRFKEVLTTWSQLIGWTRNLGFLQTGSDYFTVAIPFLVLGPLYFAGTVEMGSIGRAAMAFGQVLSALTLVVSEFGGISLFLSRVNRLGTFTESLDKPEDGGTVDHIDTQVGDSLAYKSVTLMTPNRKRTLVRDLDLEVGVDTPVVIMGPSGSGKSSLLRALAGLPQWNRGEGQIIRPSLDKLMFLPQVPYMLLGTLRDQLLYRSAGAVSDEQLNEVLKVVNLPDIVSRVGGYDAVLPWSDVLSPGEQQRLAFARLLVAKPENAILDEATSALDEVNEENVYALLHASGTRYASVGHRPSLLKYHRRVLRLDGNGGWTLADSSEFVGSH